MEEKLKFWVEDQLFSLLGSCEISLVKYFIDLATKSASEDEFRAIVFSELKLEKSRDFADSLYQKIHGMKKRKISKSIEENLFVDDEATILSEQERMRSLESRASNLVRMDKPSSQKKRKLRVKDSEDGYESDPEEQEERIRRWEARREEKLEMDPEYIKEQERLKDLEEKKEFEERLKKKDEEKTNYKSVASSSKFLSADDRKRLQISDSLEARNQVLPELRELSRQKYLTKREEQKLEELRLKIEDEQRLFNESELTELERKRLEYNKQLLKLAEERKNIDVDVEGYKMPDNYIDEKGRRLKKEEDVLKKRYQEPKKAASEKAEDGGWEAMQVKKSQSQYGKSTHDTSYDFVFDEEHHIEFLKNHTEPGDLEEHEKPRMKAVETKRQDIEQVRRSLPVYEYKSALLEAISEHQVMIIVGETGSGKTTQIPQYLIEDGYTKDGKLIGCTQPRRVAAMSVANRVAEEMQTKVGNQVGYSIRFEDCTSERTVLKYMTDGMLLREFMTQPDLASYSVIIIDEAHERTLHTDILFALIKDVSRARPDLRVLIASATMDAQKFSEYFDDAPIFNIPGRKYPVDILYTKSPEANYVAAAVTTIFQIHISQGPGDILVFLTGQDEIETAQENILTTAESLGSKIKELIVCPIYSTMPSDQQQKIFEPTPPGARKVVLATNIAETSITIDGISFVIDPGFVKQKSYSPKTGMESLIVVPCSKASANQRAGRAGRVGPGKCFRLYTSWAYEHELEENPVPEIQRTNLGNVVLLLKSLGINDLVGFDFMDPPPAETIMRAAEQLYALRALNDRGELTKIGRKMAEFPIDPMMSKALISSEQYQCSDEVVSIMAMLSVQNSLFYRPKNKSMQADKAKLSFIQSEGDHLMLLNVWNQWCDTNYSNQWCFENFIQVRSMKRARDVRDQLVGLLDRVDVELISNPDSTDTSPIRKAITSGFFYNAAKLQLSGETYRTLKQNQIVMIHPSSCLFQKNPKLVLYYELVLTSKEYMRQVMEIRPEWLVEVAPHYYKEKELMDGNRGFRKMSKTLGKSKK